MSVLSILRAAGLHTVANNLESVPNGAFATMDNCVIRSKDVVESRRGQKLATSYVASAALTDVYFYAGSILARITGGTLTKDTGAAFSNYTNASSTIASSASSYRLKAAQAAGRLYLASGYGPLRLNSLATTALQRAGTPPLHLDWTNSVPLASSAGFLTVNKAVGYRAVRVRIDPAEKEIVGPPSGKLIIRNPAQAAVAVGALSRTGTTVTASTGTTAHGFQAGQIVVLAPGEANFAAGNKTITAVTAFTFTYTEAGSATTNGTAQTFELGRCYVQTRVYLDSAALAGDILRVYRSEMTALAADNPSDEVLLAYEAVISSANISAGYVQFNDFCPDGFLGDPAYFVPSKETGLQSNDEPPLADDIAAFDDRLWFGNCEERAFLEIDLLATGGSSGLTSGDILYVNVDGGAAIALTAGTHFTVYSGGDAASDVERTAQSIVSAINAGNPNADIRAEYVSEFTDAPGRIMLTHKQPNASHQVFAYASAHGAAWNPVLPTTQGDAYGKGKERPHWVFFSKPGQPDAVPAVSYLPVGDEDDAILRILPLNDKLFVLKQRSVWIVSGPYPFSVYRLGGKLETLAPDSAAVLQDRIYVLTTQGIVAISEAGFDFVGLPIELDVTSLFGTCLAAVKAYGFGIAYESERTYLLGLPTTSSDTSCTQWFAFNVLTGCWTRWPITRMAGGVNPATDTLYMADASATRLYVERKAYDETDFADAETSITISAIAGNVLTIPTTLPVIGDAIVQGSAKSLVTAVSGSGPYSVTVQSSSGFTVAAATLYTAISCTVKWQTQHMGQPSAMKHLEHIKLLFRQMAFRLATLTVATEQASTGATAKSLSRPSYALGFTGVLGPRNERSYAPQEQSRACYFDVTFAIREARARWKLQGLVMRYELDSDREPRT